MSLSVVLADPSHIFRVKRRVRDREFVDFVVDMFSAGLMTGGLNVSIMVFDFLLHYSC
uniref:Uncharacterized protein n=1 Tax=Kalanchoe fedtschenkoi TaxID=63787 RepID=A0A7N0VLH3_KALFE